MLGKEIVGFIGPEGSGKSTIAKKLSKETDKPYISIGDVLRDLAEHDEGEIGEQCRIMFSKHTYLDPVLLLAIQEDHFRKEDKYKDGFVMDGGLRSTAEAKGFPEMLTKANKSMPLTIVYLMVSEEISIQRLVHGRKRKDDTLEGVLSRLENFNDKLDERLALIKENYAMFEIDAAGTIEETFAKVYEALIGRNKE